jgi:16S rRNA (guanine527-N7)-methyltransferase
MMAGPLMEDKVAARALIGVSRETEARLDVLVEQVLRWQPTKNLVSPHTLPRIWTRHVADSLQLLALAPKARAWLDLGSGAGFPGLVIAAAKADDPGFRMDLVESNLRKCAFLRDTARLMGLDVGIHQTRIEAIIAQLENQPDVVSARALASLPQLMAWCEKLLTRGVIGLFPKGKDAGLELTATAKYWRLEHTIHNSLTDPQGQIVRITQAGKLVPDAGRVGGQ